MLPTKSNRGRLPLPNEILKVGRGCLHHPFQENMAFKMSNPTLMALSLKSWKWSNISKSKESCFESVTLYQSPKLERRQKRDQNKQTNKHKTLHRTIHSPSGAWRQNWTKDASFMMERRSNFFHLSTETRRIQSHSEGSWDPKQPEGSNPMQKGLDVFSGTPPVVLLHVCLDCVQALTDSGPTYRRMSKAERYRMKVNTENLLTDSRL